MPMDKYEPFYQYDEFIRATMGLIVRKLRSVSVTQASRETGLCITTIKKIRRGEWQNLTPAKTQKLIDFLKGRYGY